MASFEEMFSAVVDNDEGCYVCKFDLECSHGCTLGPNGPYYPPCVDRDPADWVDEVLLEQEYQELMDAEVKKDG